jgi:hypothetical protein
MIERSHSQPDRWRTLVEPDDLGSGDPRKRLRIEVNQYGREKWTFLDQEQG